MILHIDMDAFYASVEIRDFPHLQHKPVVVGGPAESRSVVSAACYIARRYGIHSAMPMVSAKRRCADLVIQPLRMFAYVEASQQIREIFERYTPVIEPLSLDEAFLDVAASQRLFGTPIEIAAQIKATIWAEVQLVASVGVAPNKFLAKMASDHQKPDGFMVVQADKIHDFLDPMPITRLWGVGKATAAKLQHFGISKIVHIRQQTELFMQQNFGQHGLQLLRLANGVDSRKVITESEAKSISHETTFAKDSVDEQYLKSVLLELTEQVAWRLRRKSLKGRTIQLKLRFADFKTITRSFTLDQASFLTDDLWQVSLRLFNTVRQQNRQAVRLIGMGVSGFNQAEHQQQDLFEQSDPSRLRDKKQTSIDCLTDEINQRYGKNSVKRGGSLTKK